MWVDFLYINDRGRRGIGSTKHRFSMFGSRACPASYWLQKQNETEHFRRRWRCSTGNQESAASSTRCQQGRCRREPVWKLSKLAYFTKIEVKFKACTNFMNTCSAHIPNTYLRVIVVNRQKILRAPAELGVHGLANVIRPNSGTVIEKLLSRSDVENHLFQ